MNIFTTSYNPMECARDLDTRRLSKMILETCQLLSTAKYYRLNDWDFFNDTQGYKPTHKNHPCAIWARESINNYTWLMELLEAYAEEYTRRKGKQHKSYVDQVLSDNLNVINHNINWFENMLPFPNCARNKEYDIDFSYLPVTTAYKKYLRYRYLNTDKYKPTWLGDYVPEWFNL